MQGAGRQAFCDRDDTHGAASKGLALDRCAELVAAKARSRLDSWNRADRPVRDEKWLRWRAGGQAGGRGRAVAATLAPTEACAPALMLARGPPASGPVLGLRLPSHSAQEWLKKSGVF